MKPTLEEVAKVAGVSRATVSRVVNNSPKVTPAVRAAVESAIDSMGYVPNRAARSLVTRRTDAIALVVAEPDETLFSNPFFGALTSGFAQVSAELDKQIVLLMGREPEELARVERFLGTRAVDGAAFTSLHGDDSLPARLEESGMPVAIGGRPFAHADLAYVDVDNLGGSAAAVELLIRRGRTRIATITGPLDMNASADRLDGWRAALEKAGMVVDPDLIEASDFSRGGGERAAAALLDRCPDIDAVFAASDLMAAGALSAIVASGRRVPDDVALLGFDDSVVARTTDPPLSSVRQPVSGLGGELARQLLRRMAGEPTPPVILPTELVERGST